MLTKTRLIWIVLTLSAVGLSAALYPFAAALSPNARSDAELPRIPIPALDTRELVFIHYWQSWSLLFVRDEQAVTRAFTLPKYGGTYFLPGVKPYSLGPTCTDLRVDKVNSRIVCADHPEQWGSIFTLQGQSLSDFQADLQIADGVIGGDTFVLYAKAKTRREG